MNELLDIKPGGWRLILTPKSIRMTILTLIARMAQHSPLLIFDGGNQFNVFQVARGARGQPEVLGRIRVSRAFTCYQMTSLLESTSSTNTPVLLLDFLSTFYDESVRIMERHRLLEKCLKQIHRLSRSAGVLVTVHPPALPSEVSMQLIRRMQNQDTEVWLPELPTPAPEPLRLF